jgi:hypothetical protein
MTLSLLREAGFEVEAFARNFIIKGTSLLQEGVVWLFASLGYLLS